MEQEGIYPVKHLDITIDESNILEGAFEVVSCIRPKWRNITAKVCTRLLVNILHHGYISDLLALINQARTDEHAVKLCH